MKLNIKQLLVLACLLISTLSFGQAPQKFNYQGIARDVKGNPLAKQKMSLKISVLPTQDATVSEYEETQIVTTNEFGLYTLQIGAGTPISGEMKTVKWETGNKYIKIAIDQKGGTDYVDAGTTQLLSVPYAIYADKAGLARETVEGTDKTRTGAVSSNAAHVAGDANYVSKFTALNTIGKSSIYDNGNVGIGTTTPAAKLQVTGTTTTPTELRIQHTNTGSGGASRLSFKNDNLAGFVVGSDFAIMNKYAAGNTGNVAPGYPASRLFGFNNSMGNLLFSSNGSLGFGSYNISATPQVTVRMHIDSATGNVGIGTVTPAAKLEVAGQVKISGGTPGAGKVLTSDAAGLATWTDPKIVNGHLIPSVNCVNNLGSLSARWDSLFLCKVISLDGAPFVHAGGSVGFNDNTFIGNTQASSFGSNNTMIGAQTAISLTSGFENTAIGDDAAAQLTVGIQNSMLGDDAGYSTTNGNNNTFVGQSSGSSNIHGNNNVTLGDASNVGSDSLNFATAIGSGSIVNSDNSVVLGRSIDKVGIGTSNPSYKLHVLGDFYTGYFQSTGTENYLGFQNSVGYNAYLGNYTNAAAGAFDVMTTGNYALNLGTSYAPRIRIEGDGKIGIHGTNTIGSSLDLFDNGLPSAMHIGTNNGGLLGYVTINRPTTSTSSGILRIRDENTTKALFDIGTATYQLTVTGSALASGGVWTNSDMRIKKDITNIEGALSNIMKLRPTSYYFKKDEKYSYLGLPSNKQFGLIAQEVREVFPNIVNETHMKDEDGKEREESVLSMNYTELVPVLIKGMQEQQEQIKLLKEEIEILKSK